MSAIKVNVSPENPVQELGNGWRLEYYEGGDYFGEITLPWQIVKLDGLPAMVYFKRTQTQTAQERMQEFIDNLYAALTEKESEACK